MENGWLASLAGSLTPCNALCVFVCVVKGLKEKDRTVDCQRIPAIKGLSAAEVTLDLL